MHPFLFAICSRPIDNHDRRRCDTKTAKDRSDINARTINERDDTKYQKERKAHKFYRSKFGDYSANDRLFLYYYIIHDTKIRLALRCSVEQPIEFEKIGDTEFFGTLG